MKLSYEKLAVVEKRCNVMQIVYRQRYPTGINGFMLKKQVVIDPL